MGTASSTPLSAKCSLCSQLYDDPRMLPCLHSFCSKCLEKEVEKQHQNKTLKCPLATCARSSSLPEGGLQTLPKDLRKVYEVEVAQHMSKIQNTNNHRIQMMTTSGVFISKFGSEGSNAGQLKSPQGICLDRVGRVFVSESGNNRVSVFEPDGTFAYHITGNLSNPWGITFDASGNLHVVSNGSHEVHIYTPEGTYVNKYASPVNLPAGIAIDVEGYVFLGEYSTSNTSGNYSRLAILDQKYQTIGTVQNFTYVPGICVDKEGYVYICSRNRCEVFKY